MPELRGRRRLSQSALKKLSPFLQLSLLVHGGALLALWWFPGWALLVLLGNHLAITAAGLLPRCGLLGANRIRLPRAARQRGEIALTIDDGPDPQITPAVLDILDRAGAQATFFCIGERALRHPELCREIVRRGHAVENHSQRHRHTFALRGYRFFRRELELAQTTLQTITGVLPRFFRAPAGLRNPFLDPALQHTGLQLVAWTRRGFDTRCADPALVLRRLTQHLRAGDILLLHDGNAARGGDGRSMIEQVLPPLLAAITARGLHPVTLRAAIAAGADSRIGNS